MVTSVTTTLVSVDQHGTRPDRPAPLTVAASLVAVEGAVIVLLGVLEVFSFSAARATMGVTTAAFFLAYGAGLVAAAWAMAGLRTWARSPVVLAQLIQLGLAWSFRGGGTTLVAVALAVVALVVVAGVLHPASTEALVDEPPSGA